MLPRLGDGCDERRSVDPVVIDHRERGGSAIDVPAAARTSRRDFPFLHMIGESGWLGSLRIEYTSHVHLISLSEENQRIRMSESFCSLQPSIRRPTIARVFSRSNKVFRSAFTLLHVTDGLLQIGEHST